ncbi:unnamed protein product [Prunus armeniaca]
MEEQSMKGFVHSFCVYSYDGRAKFPTALRTIDWSTSQLSLVCERATAKLQCTSSFCEAFEWAELRFPQSARAEVTVFEDFSGLETVL